MANRFFNQFSMSLEKNPVTLWAKVAIGATGAPTLDAVNSKGVKSISRTSAGLYVLTLGTGSATDIYNRIFFASHRFFLAAGAPAAPLMHVKAQAVATNGTVTVQFLAPDGTTATDPASGEELWLEFKLKNSTAQ
jgi:hypothetical protein